MGNIVHGHDRLPRAHVKTPVPGRRLNRHHRTGSTIIGTVCGRHWPLAACGRYLPMVETAATCLFRSASVPTWIRYLSQHDLDYRLAPVKQIVANTSHPVSRDEVPLDRLGPPPKHQLNLAAGSQIGEIWPAR